MEFTNEISKMRTNLKNITGYHPLNNSDLSELLETNLTSTNRNKGWLMWKLAENMNETELLKHSTKRNIVSNYNDDNQVNNHINNEISEFHTSLSKIMKKVKYCAEQTQLYQSDLALSLTNSGLNDNNNWMAYTILDLAQHQGILQKLKEGPRALIKSGMNGTDEYIPPNTVDIKNFLNTKSFGQSEYESKFAKFIGKKFPNVCYWSQKTFPGLKNKMELRYDFFFPDYNLLIEIDGPEHKREPIHDKIKTEYAMENDLALKRIENHEINNTPKFFKKIEKLFSENA